MIKNNKNIFNNEKESDLGLIFSKLENLEKFFPLYKTMIKKHK